MSNTLAIIYACWKAGCSHRQIAAITKELSGTWLSEAAIADHINDFESEAQDVVGCAKTTATRSDIT